MEDEVVRDGREIVDNIVASLNQHRASSSPQNEAEWDDILRADHSPQSRRSPESLRGAPARATSSGSPRYQIRPRPGTLRSSSGASVGSGHANIVIGERSSSIFPGTSSTARVVNMEPGTASLRGDDDVFETSARTFSLEVKSSMSRYLRMKLTDCVVHEPTVELWAPTVASYAFERTDDTRQ
jgi:hypothetical protein